MCAGVFAYECVEMQHVAIRGMEHFKIGLVFISNLRYRKYVQHPLACELVQNELVMHSLQLV